MAHIICSWSGRQEMRQRLEESGDGSVDGQTHVDIKNGYLRIPFPISKSNARRSQDLKSGISEV